MDVKTASRTLALFEAFAALRKPASLSEIAKQLDIPVSSCFSLVRTIENRGYLYSVGSRRGLYPTKRLLELARTIAAHDPVASRVADALSALRDASGETIVLGKRRHHEVVYLDVYESAHRIRYTATVGETRQIHSNSIGKAVLGAMPADERAALMASLTYTRHTPLTLASPSALEADLERSRARGWYANISETVVDVMALALPTAINGELFGVSLAGPLYRIEPVIEEQAARLRAACREIGDAE